MSSAGSKQLQGLLASQCVQSYAAIYVVSLVITFGWCQSLARQQQHLVQNMEDAHEIELQENPVAAPTQTLFGEGFATPWMRRNQQRGVPWDQVQEVLCMARSALIAKQQAAEVRNRPLHARQLQGATCSQQQQPADCIRVLLLQALLKEIEQMRKSAMKDKLLERVSACSHQDHLFSPCMVHPLPLPCL